jgi:hypothetical protein
LLIQKCQKGLHFVSAGEQVNQQRLLLFSLFEGNARLLKILHQSWQVALRLQQGIAASLQLLRVLPGRRQEYKK